MRAAPTTRAVVSGGVPPWPVDRGDDLHRDRRHLAGHVAVAPAHRLDQCGQTECRTVIASGVDASVDQQ
jgi:hypothetical protein